MHTPLDTALLTHPAKRHCPPGEAERAARAMRRVARAAAFRDFVRFVFSQAPLHPNALQSIRTPGE